MRSTANSYRTYQKATEPTFAKHTADAQFFQSFHKSVEAGVSSCFWQVCCEFGS